MNRWLIAILVLCLAPIARAQDPTASLTSAVAAYIKKKGGTEQPVFRHAFTDLNGDAQADAIVVLLGTYWCGSGGCTMLIFSGTKNGFTLVSASTVTREPIRVSPEKAHGWNTLIVNAKGQGDVLMPFNGSSYPSNPSLQPQAKPAQVGAAQTVMQ